MSNVAFIFHQHLSLKWQKSVIKTTKICPEVTTYYHDTGRFYVNEDSPNNNFNKYVYSFSSQPHHIFSPNIYEPRQFYHLLSLCILQLHSQAPHFSLFIFVSDDESDPEAAELDLGTKIKTPKDVMLEELSLLNNKGSKMFKMRQQRVEKFIVTNENNVRPFWRKGVRFMCICVCWLDSVSLFCLLAEPSEPTDVPSPYSTKAWDAKGRRQVPLSAPFSTI